MNKLAIPAILVATVMVAGIFAFIPVEQASTVHDTITADLELKVATTEIATLDAVDEGDDVFAAALDGIDVSDAIALTVQVVIDGGVDLDDDCDLELTVTDASNGVDFNTGGVLLNDVIIFNASDEVDPVAGDVVLHTVDLSIGAFDTVDMILDLEDGGDGGVADCDNASDWDLTVSVIKKGPNLT